MPSAAAPDAVARSECYALHASPPAMRCNDHRVRPDMRLRKLVLAAEYRRVAHNPRKSFFARLGNAYLIIRVSLINL